MPRSVSDALRAQSAEHFPPFGSRKSVGWQWAEKRRQWGKWGSHTSPQRHLSALGYKLPCRPGDVLRTESRARLSQCYGKRMRAVDAIGRSARTLRGLLATLRRRSLHHLPADPEITHRVVRIPETTALATITKRNPTNPLRRIDDSAVFLVAGLHDLPIAAPRGGVKAGCRDYLAVADGGPRAVSSILDTHVE